MSGTPEMVCAGLSLWFGARQVLADVSFRVGRGTFCVLLGRNGAGKTSLLSCLGGLLRPGGGRVSLEGLDLARARRREVAQRLALVPQEHTQVFPFQVLDVVVMGRTPFLRLNQRPGGEDYAQARAALEAMEAGYLAERNFNAVSGGERQLALLARAWLQSQENLLLDEPTNHLDFGHQHRLLARIRELCHQRGARVVAAMHDPNLALLYADQVVLLAEGRVLEEGPPGRVMTPATVSRLYQTPIRRVDLGEGGGVFLPAAPGEAAL
ncbi:MAG: ABC transporter ATP-binding protein [Deltaproteobacteria bacterium]|nr:ABC transporter ATP-binding protein [Deltaproteobacteria bacterium]